MFARKRNLVQQGCPHSCHEDRSQPPPLRPEPYSPGLRCAEGPLQADELLFRHWAVHPTCSQAVLGLQGKPMSKSALIHTFDFMAEPVARTNSFVGTEEYLAPEIIIGAHASLAFEPRSSPS